MGRLKDKVVLITGGTTGIGAATAKLFQAQGAEVIVTGSNPTTLEAARQSMPGIEIIQSDAHDLSAIAETIDQIKAQHCRIDVLFVNAAVTKFSPVESVDRAFFDNLFDINVRGAYFAVKHAVDIMPNGGSIILTSSISGMLGVNGQTVYAATKASIRSFGRTFAREFAPRGIRVNTISPGLIDTVGPAKAGVSLDQRVSIAQQMVPLGRLGRPEEVASVALFFASADSSFVTGAQLFVDGGLVEM
jgi:NAD(P)-dependent dehydrogenase (short-subunit alcohol dehydrogenase family)